MFDLVEFKVPNWNKEEFYKLYKKLKNRDKVSGYLSKADSNRSNSDLYTYVEFDGRFFRAYRYEVGAAPEDLEKFHALELSIPDDLFSNPEKYQELIKTDIVISYGLDLIRKDGFVSKKADAESATGTKILNWARSYPSNYPVNDQEIGEVKSFAKDLQFKFSKGNEIESSSYSGNHWANAYASLRAESFNERAERVITSDYMLPTEASVIAFPLSMFLKEKDKKAEREEKNKAETERKVEAGYLGNVGEKVTFTVKSCRVAYTKEPYTYGALTTYLWVIETEDGNEVVWSTSNSVIEGRTYTGTVKALKEFRGAPQTVVTRCKEV